MVFTLHLYLVTIVISDMHH